MGSRHICFEIQNNCKKSKKCIMSEKSTALYNKIEILYQLRGSKYYIVRK